MEMTFLTGAEFNLKFKGIEFVKLTSESEVHNGFQFRTGLNVDIIPFDPSGSCKIGGLYFCRKTDLHLWTKYRSIRMVHVREVIIPDDAQVYDEINKLKCDKFILGQKSLISDLKLWSDKNFLLSMLPMNTDGLKYVQNVEFLLYLVRHTNPRILSCFNEQMRMEVIKQNGMFLQFVTQTPELCMEAVKQNGMALRYVKKQTPEICLVAVKQDGQALKYVNEQTEKICLGAIKQDGRALKYVNVNEQTEEICLWAVKQYYDLLQHVNKKTPLICAVANQQGWTVVAKTKKNRPQR
jgi:hypothetical protein